MTSNQPNKAPHSRQRAAAYDLNVLLLEPYYTGSHKAWTDGLMAASQATIDLLALPGQFWKWRMCYAADYPQAAVLCWDVLCNG